MSSIIRHGLGKKVLIQSKCIDRKLTSNKDDFESEGTCNSVTRFRREDQAFSRRLRGSRSKLGRLQDLWSFFVYLMSIFLLNGLAIKFIG